MCRGLETVQRLLEDRSMLYKLGCGPDMLQVCIACRSDMEISLRLLPWRHRPLRVARSE